MLGFSINLHQYKFHDKNMTPIILYLGSPSLQSTLEKVFPHLIAVPNLSTLVHTIAKRYPHMIFLEDIEPETSIQQTSTIRNKFPQAALPVVIFGTRNWLPHQKSSLSVLNHAYRITSSLPHQKIHEEIDLLLDISYFDRIDDECHPHALALLIDVFREEKNGFLYNPYRNIPLRDGGVITLDADQQLELFLNEEQPLFEEREDSGLGDWLLVMETLWNKLEKMTQPGFLSHRRNLRLSTHTQYNRLFSLPLSKKALSLLFETNPENTIQQRLEQQKIPQSAIELELEILYKMGFCSFQIARKNTNLSPPIHHEHVSNEEEGWNKLTLLKKEHNLLIKKASPHFFRTLLEKQQHPQKAEQDKEILNCIRAGCYIQAYRLLYSIQKPSWIHLQLLCWTQLNIAPEQKQTYKRLAWLHEQKPTHFSSIFLCVIHSEQSNFPTANTFLTTATELSQHHQKYKKLKQMLLNNTPIPRTIAQNLLTLS